MTQWDRSASKSVEVNRSLSIAAKTQEVRSRLDSLQRNWKVFCRSIPVCASHCTGEWLISDIRNDVHTVCIWSFDATLKSAIAVVAVVH